MTAVEELVEQLTSVGALEIPQGSNAVTSIIAQAKEMEKENLIDMSVKSALYERKWLYEEMSGKKYKPTKVEIRDLKITVLEHYNETFKSE